MSEMPDLSSLLSILSNRNTSNPSDNQNINQNNASNPFNNQQNSGNNNDSIYFVNQQNAKNNVTFSNNQQNIRNNTTASNNQQNSRNNDDTTNYQTNNNQNNSSENIENTLFSLLNSSSDNVPDMQTIMKIMQVMKSANENTPSKDLLLSLKPFLNEKRKAKVDQYIKLLGMSKILEILK